MGIYLRIKSLDLVYQNTKHKPVLANDYDLSTEEGREALDKKIFTRYEGNVLDTMPVCECGEMRGWDEDGQLCMECYTKCVSITEREVESTLWIAPPKGVVCFMNPTVRQILSEALTHKRTIDLLEWLLNPLLVIDDKTVGALIKLKTLGFERGMNYFYENFDRIIDALFEHRLFKLKFTGSKRPRDELRLFITQNRDRIFCKQLPFPSKLNFIMEKTVSGNTTYADIKMGPAIEAVRTICAAEDPHAPLPIKQRLKATSNVMKYLGEYYTSFNKDLLAPKEGYVRKHIVAGRLEYTFRCVITSLSDNHDYEEITIPWSISIMSLKVHLESKLQAQGMTPIECSRFINENVAVYHPMMEKVLYELIEESPWKGIPVIVQRNPTLDRLSAQLVYATRINPDPTINAMYLSTLILKGPGADFDGDQLNAAIVLDEELHEYASRLAPHLGAMDLMEPDTVSGNLAIPVQPLSNINVWLEGGVT